MEYIQQLDRGALAASAGHRFTQVLRDGPDGAKAGRVSYISTPPGEGSSHGLHTHPFDQTFYVLAGVMQIEIAGDVHEVGADTIVLFPAHTPHRNWNAGTVPTVHLAINSPSV